MRDGMGIVYQAVPEPLLYLSAVMKALGMTANDVNAVARLDLGAGAKPGAVVVMLRMQGVVGNAAHQIAASSAMLKPGQVGVAAGFVVFMA